jgi:PAS domain S-box-containing protein
MESEKTKEELLEEIERLQRERTRLETSMTQQRRAREEAEIFCSVVAQTDDLVVITDPNGIIEYVNPSFERTSGYGKEEALGKTPRIVKSGKQGLKFYKALWRTISSGQAFLGIFVNRRKDGSFYYEQKTITPLKNAQGRITHYLSTGKDITARMQAEEERARLITILEATTDLVMITDLDGKIRYINRAGQTTLGLEEKNPFPEHGTDTEILMRRADAAMYAAKQSGSEYMVYDIEAERRDAA